jgi:hypothetical protein
MKKKLLNGLVVVVFLFGVIVSVTLANCSGGSQNEPEPYYPPYQPPYQPPEPPQPPQPPQPEQKHKPTTTCNGNCKNLLDEHLNVLCSDLNKACQTLVSGLGGSVIDSYILQSFNAFESAYYNSWEARGGQYHENYESTSGRKGPYRFTYTVQIDGKGYRMPCHDIVHIEAGEIAAKAKMEQLIAAATSSRQAGVTPTNRQIIRRAVHIEQKGE